MNEALSDEQLMRQWQEGDFHSFRALYERHRGPLYRFILRQLPKASAEDIYQETWSTFIRQKDTWRPRASLKTFLYQIAHSRLVDYFRSQGRHRRFEDEAKDEEESFSCPLPTPEEAALKKRDAEALRHCLERLPPEQKEAFLLSEEGELKRADIAQVTGVKDETVKSRIRYALSRLRDCLSGFREAT